MLYREPLRAILGDVIHPGEELEINDGYADASLTIHHRAVMKADSSGRYPAIYTSDEMPILQDEGPKDDNGNPMPFAIRYFYKRRTLVLAEVWDSSSFDVNADNPQVADSGGSFQETYLDTEKQYRVILHDQYGRLVYDIDVVPIESETVGIYTIQIGTRSGVPTQVGFSLILEPNFGTVLSNSVAHDLIIAVVAGGGFNKLQISIAQAPSATPLDYSFFSSVTLSNVGTFISNEAEFVTDSGDRTTWQWGIAPNLDLQWPNGSTQTIEFTFPF